MLLDDDEVVLEYYKHGAPASRGDNDKCPIGSGSLLVAALSGKCLKSFVSEE